MLNNIIALSIIWFVIAIFPIFGLSVLTGYIIGYLWSRNRYYYYRYESVKK